MSSPEPAGPSAGPAAEGSRKPDEPSTSQAVTAPAPSSSLSGQLLSSLVRIFSLPVSLFCSNLLRLFRFTWSLLGIDSRRCKLTSDFFSCDSEHLI